MNLSKHSLTLFFSFFLLFPSLIFAQLVVSPNQTATVLASTLAGPGVTILNPTLTCPGVANGTFTVSGTLLTMSSGILLTNGHSAAAVGPYGPPPGTASFNDGAPGDPVMGALLGGASTFDACILQFDVVAIGDSIGFNYQFGSQEYYSAVCSRYNDAFAFFISGPGIVGTPNMALVPGTTIPVQINSVNNGIPGSSGGVLSNCTSLGAGSPFTAYYIDNTGGLQLSYKGFTTKFRAAHAVTPCDTYHLKLDIVDAGNAIYDSGVFLEGASLTTSNYVFNHADSIGAVIDGLRHVIVKGCSPTTITVLSSTTFATPQTVHFTYGGTGVHGTDFTAPDSAVLAAGTDSLTFSVAGIPTPASGIKTVEIYLSSPTGCGIVDSVFINIMDTPSASILTPDTTVCAGTVFQMRTTGTPGLAYSWTPATGLSSSSAMQPMVTAAATTTYTLSATLPGSGCPPIIKTETVSIIGGGISILTPPTSICSGGSVSINVSGSASLTYTWSPAAGLSSATVQNPVASPTVTTTYVVTASAPGGGCTDTASITITVGALSVAILTPDTTICSGDSITLQGSGSTGPSYLWTPSTGLNSPTLLDPLAAPTATTSYTLTASWAGSGCPPASASVLVTVINASSAMVNGDTSICSGSAVYLNVVAGAGLSYSWTPATGLSNPSIANPIATPTISTTYVVTVKDPTGACASTDTVNIAVGNPDVSILTPDTSVCKGSAVKLLVQGNPNLTYSWSPGLGISNPDIMQPFASPSAPTTYILTVSVPGVACSVSDTVRINVVDARLTNVTPNQTINFGSSIQLNADNAEFFMWSPFDGSLNNQNINDPVATPKVPTTYIVTGIDSNGCIASDSVTINLVYGQIFIPDAFTPNNDGLNDFFRVGNLGFYKLVNMSVYDRWGNMVYHITNGDNKGWDGTFQGTPLDLGVYSYLIIIGQPDGVQQVFKGNVTLIR